MKRFLIAVAMLFYSSAAFCQIPVTDVVSVAQAQLHSIQELAQMGKQLAEQVRLYKTTYDQLMTVKQQLAAIAGGRGMELLLSGQLNAWLPADAVALVGLAASARSGMGGGAQGKLMSASYALNSILTPAVMANLTPAQRELILAARDATAIASSSADLAYQRTQQRMAYLKTLQMAIPTAIDPAARAELANAISVEQASLANEQISLQAIGQSAQAETAAMERRIREQSARFIGRGSYASVKLPTLF